MWLAAILALACTPYPRHVTVAAAESVWVEVAGAGETVVLVPGLLGSAWSYRHVLPRLHELGYLTVVIEPLGVGNSSRPRAADYSLTAQADRLAAVLDSLAESRVLVVAHAIGVSMALRLAYRRPELVRAVVALDGGAAATAATSSMRAALRFAPLLRLLGGRGRARRELASQLRAASADPGWVTEAVIDGYSRPFLADLGRSLTALRAMAGAREPESLAEQLCHVRAPVLLIHGATPAKRTGLRQPEIDTLLSRLPDLTVEALPDVGHHIHEERPAAVVAAVACIDARTRAGAGHERRKPCVP